MNVMKQRVIGATLAGLMSIGMHAQLVVSTDLTPAQLVQDVLLGSGITVSNVTFNGIADPTTAQPGTGSFVTSGSNLGVPAGIILSTGFAEGIASGQDGFQSDQLVPDISDPDLAGIAGIAASSTETPAKSS